MLTYGADAPIIETVAAASGKERPTRVLGRADRHLFAARKPYGVESRRL